MQCYMILKLEILLIRRAAALSVLSDAVVSLERDGYSLRYALRQSIAFDSTTLLSLSLVLPRHLKPSTLVA